MAFKVFDKRHSLFATSLILFFAPCIFGTQSGSEQRGTFREADAPIVKLKHGLVSGKVLKSENGRTYFAYMGIPYAAPPTGKYRFQFPRPLPDKAWDGVLRCVKNAPKCPQLSSPEGKFEGQDDCLYLNVYSHRIQDTALPMDDLLPLLRPVLVFLHGGGFKHGSADFDAVGPERFMDNEKDVILVTVNYRLGALGFLSVGQDPAVGNMGMKDQFKALGWVQGNIAQFGGHPGKVTLGGYEAGAVSAHLHALSPLTSTEPDMFWQTLALSGTALAPWAVISAAEARRRAIKLGTHLGCVGNSDKDINVDALVRCLRTKPAEDLVRKSEHVMRWSSDFVYPFVPVVEQFDGKNRPFMVTHPQEVLQGGLPGLRAKTLVAGCTTHEGLPQALQMMVYKGSLAELNENFEDRVWDYLGLGSIASYEQRRAAGRKIKAFYLPANVSISLDTISGLIDLTSDALYLHGLHDTVRLHSGLGRSATLIYRFGFNRLLHKREVLGVPQGTDMELLFPAVFADTKTVLEKKETLMAKKMLMLLINYITTEDPTPKEDIALGNILWPPADGTNFTFLDVTENGRLAVNNWQLYSERMNLWDSIYRTLHPFKQSPSTQGRQKIKDEF